MTSVFDKFWEESPTKMQRRRRFDTPVDLSVPERGAGRYVTLLLNALGRGLASHPKRLGGLVRGASSLAGNITGSEEFPLFRLLSKGGEEIEQVGTSAEERLPSEASTETEGVIEKIPETLARNLDFLIPGLGGSRAFAGATLGGLLPGKAGEVGELAGGIAAPAAFTRLFKKPAAFAKTLQDVGIPKKVSRFVTETSPTEIRKPFLGKAFGQAKTQQQIDIAKKAFSKKYREISKGASTKEYKPFSNSSTRALLEEKASDFLEGSGPIFNSVKEQIRSAFKNGTLSEYDVSNMLVKTTNLTNEYPKIIGNANYQKWKSFLRDNIFGEINPSKAKKLKIIDAGRSKLHDIQDALNATYSIRNQKISTLSKSIASGITKGVAKGTRATRRVAAPIAGPGAGRLVEERGRQGEIPQKLSEEEFSRIWEGL